MRAYTTVEQLQKALKIIEKLQIQEDLEMPQVDLKSKLSAYALGLLFYEQKIAEKAKVKECILLERALKNLPEQTAEYEQQSKLLKELQRQPNLGFYYTIDLLDKLGDTHPAEAALMMEAILKFDKTGHYLLETNPIIVDDKPFAFAAILEKRGLNLTRLQAEARKIRHMTFKIPDILPRIEAGSVELTASVHSSSVHTRSMDLLARSNAARKNELLMTMASSLPLNFKWITQPPSQENIDVFVELLAQLFTHAKLYDRATLNKFGVEMQPGDNIKHYSVTTLLQNTLVRWFILGLVQAPTVAVFEQRLVFIMRAFHYIQEAPTLPANANADMFFPFILLSPLVTKSVLSHHPLVKPYLKMWGDISVFRNADAIAKYIKALPCSKGGESQRLGSTRMTVTSILAFTEEDATRGSTEEMTAQALEKHLQLEELKEEEKIKRLLRQGKFIDGYFSSQSPLTSMSQEALMLFSTQLALVPFKEEADFRALQELANVAWPSLESWEARTVPQQLFTLDCALLSSAPRVFQPAHDHTAATTMEGGDAIRLIGKKLLAIEGWWRRWSISSNDYEAGIHKWRETLLQKIKLSSRPHSMAQSSLKSVFSAPLSVGASCGSSADEDMCVGAEACGSGADDVFFEPSEGNITPSSRWGTHGFLGRRSFRKTSYEKAQERLIDLPSQRNSEVEADDVPRHG